MKNDIMCLFLFLLKMFLFGSIQRNIKILIKDDVTFKTVKREKYLCGWKREEDVGILQINKPYVLSQNIGFIH